MTLNKIDIVALLKQRKISEEYRPSDALDLFIELEQKRMDGKLSFEDLKRLMREMDSADEDDS